ncbi:hypothetical protein [Streptomyces sp. NRRL S-87]|uniref:hypothetical protein n=1 Tax=Streptomyces sp. NRRL S-87 TaxID=1463920 RepID=UPI00131AB75B|nr:hypothetical protein [Streptomyces sp. NRRL S-87]
MVRSGREQYDENHSAGRLRSPLAAWRWAAGSGLVPPADAGQGLWSRAVVEAADPEAVRAALGGPIGAGVAADRLTQALGEPLPRCRPRVTASAVGHLVKAGLLVRLGGDAEFPDVHPDQVAALARRRDLPALLDWHVPLGPDQAAPRLGVRRTDWDQVVRLGFVSPVDTVTIDLDDATANLAAWTSGMHQLDWLTARGQTQAAWSHLVTTLRTAQAHLNMPSWYNPASALTDLLQVYQASRSIRASQPSGLTGVISPTIEASFAKQEGLLQHLEQALAHDPQFTAHPDAEASHTAVRTRRMQDNGKQPPEGAPGKQLQGRPAFAALFHADTTGLRDDIDPRLLHQLEDRLQYVAKGYTPTGNTRFDDHLESLLAILATSPAWRPTDSHYVTDLLQHFLRFLYDRFDAQANLYGDRTACLGPPTKEKNGKVTPWAEKHLQDDFHQHLTGICTPGTVQREVWDVAGGRADVIYTPAPGSRLVTEMKWRDKTWTRPKIEQEYLAQAAVYTATGPPFSFLLVGDATGNPGGHPSIEDGIWVVSHARTATEIPRLVVTGVLPTARPTPSAPRTPGPPEQPRSEVRTCRGFGCAAACCWPLETQRRRSTTLSRPDSLPTRLQGRDPGGQTR